MVPCGMQDLSSPTRDWTHTQEWKFRVLSTGQPKKTLYLNMYIYIYIYIYQLLSHFWLFATLWTIAHQDPLSMRITTKSSPILCEKSSPITKIMAKKRQFSICIFTLSSGWLQFCLVSSELCLQHRDLHCTQHSQFLLLCSQNCVPQVIFLALWTDFKYLYKGEPADVCIVK